MSTTHISLHEIVDDDEQHGRSIVEEITLPSCWILTAVQMRDHAYSKVITTGRSINVKESPEEILNKIQAGNQELMNEEHLSEKEMKMFFPLHRIFHDAVKSIMIDLDLVKSIRKISKFKTEFTLKGRQRETIIIRLPLEWLDVPQDKIRKERPTTHAV